MDGTAYEQVTRQMVENVTGELTDYKHRVNGSLDKIDARLTAIEKQLNARPTWAMSAMITILSSLSVGLIVYTVTMPK